MGPGLYAIVVVKSDAPLEEKLYIGQSSNVALRLGQHWNDLSQGKHECKEMLQDWQQLGSENFSFIALSVGPQWEKQEIRENVENDLIRLNLNITYNQAIAGKVKKKEGDIYRKIVKFGDKVFPSIAEASRQVNISESHIRRLLRDPNNTDWSYVTSQKTLVPENIINIEKATKVKVNGTIYRSIRDAAKHEGIERRTLTRHLNDPNKTYCSFVD
jgi:hypothetical protein